MILGRKREEGQQVNQLQIGDSFNTEWEVKDKDILIYLGVADDINPMYIQHNYTEQTPYQKPIVPHVLMTGVLYSCINKHIPGPGSVIRSSQLDYPEVLYHYSTVNISMEIIDVDQKLNEVIISVKMSDQNQRKVLKGEVKVSPPLPLRPLHVNAFENF